MACCKFSDIKLLNQIAKHEYMPTTRRLIKGASLGLSFLSYASSHSRWHSVLSVSKTNFYLTKTWKETKHWMASMIFQPRKIFLNYLKLQQVRNQLMQLHKKAVQQCNQSLTFYTDSSNRGYFVPPNSSSDKSALCFLLANIFCKRKGDKAENQITKTNAKPRKQNTKRHM